MSFELQFIKELQEINFPLFRKGNLKITLTIAITILVIALFFPKNRYNVYNYKVNDIARETIIAPFDFPILKSKEELERDRAKARAQVNFVFKREREISEASVLDYDTLFYTIESLVKALGKFQKSKQLYNKSRFSKNIDKIKSLVYSDSLEVDGLLKYLQSKYAVDTSMSYIKYLIRVKNTAPNYFDYVYKKSRKLLESAYNSYIIDVPRERVISENISIIDNGEEIEVSKENVFALDEVWTKLKLKIQESFPEQNSEVTGYLYDILVKFIKPNLIYQKEITEARQEEAIKKVPISKGIVLKDEKIVDANTRVTPDIYRKLESLAIEKARRTNLKGSIRKELPVIGDPMTFLVQIAIVLLSYLVFLSFVFIYKSEIIKNFKHQLLISLIFVINVIVAYLFAYQLKISLYAIPVTLAALLLTILFDGRLAFSGMVSLTFILTFETGADINFMITSIMASIMAIFSVRRLRKRSQVFQSIIFIGLAYILGIVITESTKVVDTRKLLNHLLYGSLNSVITPFLAYGIIGLIEIVFGMTTELTLLEYASFDNPVLKLLSKHAPGTFTHSVIVGNLAEAAADAIGANPLLARVGAYYHDIGKVTKPEYFVENTKLGENKHEKLSPKMSAMIIRNHIKEGLKLAEEYKLPEEIKQFILTHHGTMRIEFFYKKALESSPEEDTVNEDDFRYQGELPKTRETGIVMICDSIEAAVRSMKNPNISAIEKMVDQIIRERIETGQLNECPLTLKDLKMIKGSIKENTGIMPLLVSMHHIRIEYPGQKEILKEKGGR